MICIYLNFLLMDGGVLDLLFFNNLKMRCPRDDLSCQHLSPAQSREGGCGGGWWWDYKRGPSKQLVVPSAPAFRTLACCGLSSQCKTYTNKICDIIHWIENDPLRPILKISKTFLFWRAQSLKPKHS